MADWGLYTALRGTDDWQTKRQDKAMNLMIAEKREAKAEQQIAQSAEFEEGINEYFDELKSLEVLPEDKERVLQEEKNARQKVIAGIASNNGDLKRYMSTGGITDLSDYKNNVMNSEAVQQAGINKVNLQNYLEDRKKGNQRAFNVDVDIPLLDEEGNPRVDEDGNPLTESKNVSMKDQMALFQAGKIGKINYNGSETKVKVGFKDFKQDYKNAQDPYQKDNYVSESNVYTTALGKGASDEQARQIAKEYGEMYTQGGEAWRWDSKDPNELALKQAALALKAQKQAATLKALAGRNTTATATTTVTSNIKELPVGGSLPMGVRDRPVFAKAIGLNEIPEETYGRVGEYTITTGIAYDAGAHGDGSGPKKQLHMSKAEYIVPNGYVVLPDKNGDKKYYMKATAGYDDPAQGMSQLNVLGWGKNVGEPTTDYGGVWAGYDSKHWASNDDRGTVEGEILIPIDDQITESFLYSQINKEINMNQNMDSPMGSATHEGTGEKLGQYGASGINAGLSPEQVDRALQILFLENKLAE